MFSYSLKLKPWILSNVKIKKKICKKYKTRNLHIKDVCE